MEKIAAPAVGKVEALDSIIQVASGFRSARIQSDLVDGGNSGIVLSKNEDKPTSLKSKTPETIQVNSLKRLDGSNKLHTDLVRRLHQYRDAYVY